MPGVLHRFEAIKEGDLAGIQCTAEVMLLGNKSESLHNGLHGRVVGVRGNGVVVDFDCQGEIFVKRERHGTKTSRTGDMVGSHTQIHLCLMWGITCHKSQGLTPTSVVIHCTRVCSRSSVCWHDKG